MAKVTVPPHRQAEYYQISPDYVRISTAAAIALGLTPGRMYRDAACTCVNLLQNYPEGCYANCLYCGLARERPGEPEENSFIRVAWPVYPTRLVVEKIAQKEARDGVGRVCVSQVQDPRANDDLIDLLGRVHRASPAVPLSALISATLVDEDWLHRVQTAGADIIGIGLDAAAEDVFYHMRGRGARSPHNWEQHWTIARAARRIFGPLRVNCHVIVGLGETDRDLVDLFYQLHSEQIACYLFSFNPEPGTAMQTAPRQPIGRWRRIQLAKHLIENDLLPRAAITFDADGNMARIAAPRDVLEAAVESGVPFMTDGCPDRGGAMACNRPYGSYRPGDEFRDYPFPPTAQDRSAIREQLRLAELCAGGCGADA